MPPTRCLCRDGRLQAHRSAFIVRRVAADGRLICAAWPQGTAHVIALCLVTRLSVPGRSAARVFDVLTSDPTRHPQARCLVMAAERPDSDSCEWPSGGGGATHLAYGRGCRGSC